MKWGTAVMTTFYTACRIENHVDRRRFVEVPYVLVDTDSETTWIARRLLDGAGITPEKRRSFLLPGGQQAMRDVGSAVIRVGAEQTVEEVVFGEPGDLQIFGTRALIALKLRVDLVRKQLVPAAPKEAASG